MFKYLMALVIILLTILPVNAVDPCPTCPVPTPHIVYVTVTVTIPVPKHYHPPHYQLQHLFQLRNRILLQNLQAFRNMVYMGSYFYYL